MRDYGLDGGDSSVASPDLQKNASAAQTSGSITSKDSYSITIEGLPVKTSGKYNFVFQYYYKNPDETQSTPILGPVSATYSIPLTVPDLSTAPTNVVATGGFYSYQLKWDTPTFVSYGDTIVYESDTNSFNSSSKVVYVGTANQCTILTSDLLPKYVYVVHRDMFLDANKKGTVAGPITIQDPITVDSNPPTNNFSVGTTTVQDDPDGLFTFNKKVLFTWTANTDTSTYGYQIRFRRVGTTDYTYMSVPGRTTTSTYLYGVKAGQTYEIGVSTYDQFGNINTSDWKTYPNIVIPASTSLQADVAITAGDMKLGYGIGGDNANKGLYLGPENYWYIQGNTTSSSAARLSVGGTSDKLVWDGSNLSVTGNLTARAGTFTGNILMATSNASIYNGTINAAGNLTGNGFALNSSGLKVASGTNSVTIDAVNGRIIANAGTIGGWSLTDSLLNQNNARLSSTGYIELGGADTDNIIRIDANDPTYRVWIGRNSSSTAPFKVTKEGVLYASGAVISGNSQFSGTISVGSALSDGGTIGDVKTTASNASTTATTAYNKAVSAYDKAVAAQDSADLKIATADINAVLDADTTIINGSRVTTGTIDVARLNIAGGTAGQNSFVVDGTGIRAYKNFVQTLNVASTGDVTMSGTINATDGKIGGFTIGTTRGDLTASSTVQPRIIFSNKMYLGWDDDYPFNQYYTMRLGNSYNTTNARFLVNTKDDTFRASIDTTRTSYAMEVAVALRAYQLRYSTSAGYGLIAESSSRRFKENINYLPKTFYERILNVSPASWTYKHNVEGLAPEMSGMHSIGLIAEDLEDAGLSYFVERDMQGRPTNLQNMVDLPQLLIPIIRDLKIEVSNLKSRLEAIENG